ncbi:C40 family peptidase [Kitasatospora sp. NPDC101801]|uniref:C40 family peptidase n=1 Tax=Kitasatospora sp. NPDC101801 TaxID=3364103 RepID=UPI00380B76D6
MTSTTRTHRRSGTAAGLIIAIVLGSSAVLGCASASARPLPDPPASAGGPVAAEELLPATGPLGPDGAPAPVAAPGPAPSAETVREWVDTAVAIQQADLRLPALQADSARLHQDAVAAEQLAEAGRVRQEMLGDLLNGLAQAQYMQGGLTRLATFLSSTPEESLERWRDERLSADALARRYREAEEVRQARAQLADAARTADAAAADEVRRTEAGRGDLTHRQGELRGDLATRFGDGSWRPGLYQGTLPADLQADPTAHRAVAYALAHLGSPYVWGATGPAEFDCSGLTSRAWDAAGVTIPRTSQEQWAQLPRVPTGAPLRPGDLVIYFAEATHVGLYVGDGLVVHAPRPGTVVRLTSLQRMPVAGVVRPAAVPPVAAP